MGDRESEICYKQIVVKGIVQGIGFRPFVFRMAKRYGLLGSVENCFGYVEILVTGQVKQIEKFIGALENADIPHIRMNHIDISEISPFSAKDFVIKKSNNGCKDKDVYFFSPDIAVCEMCRGEIFQTSMKEQQDGLVQYGVQNIKRVGHYFNTCVSCGPRFSILEAFPYDRENTSMKKFLMCDTCKAEYENVNNPRFHAETISCKDCGPVLLYKRKGNKSLQANTSALSENLQETALKQAVHDLKNGDIIAIKGIGGYHFACLPYHSESVKRLRELKGREQKPFAVMFRDIYEIKKVCHVRKSEETVLCSDARPITLCKIKQNPFASEVLYDNNRCGCFLPYTPLHELMMEQIPCLILTSANRSGSPLITKDKDILSLWKDADQYFAGVLYHGREIIRCMEDSVVQVVCGDNVQIIRRGRGYVPLPIFMVNKQNISCLAMGSDLKSSFALINGENVIISQYIGDLENAEVFQNYCEAVEDFKNLFQINPKRIICDSHPGYFSNQLAKELAEKENIELSTVLHHHAHVASVMAEHSLKGKVLGIAFDGNGYGDDEKIWGGEFLLCEETHYKRVGHLEYTKMLGRDTAAKDALKAAVCFLSANGIQPLNTRMHKEEAIIKAALKSNINTFLSSSIGRLFDAVSALLDICYVNDYEGQCAVMLQQCAEHAWEQGIKAEEMYFIPKEQEGKIIFGCKDIMSKVVDGEMYAASLGFHIAIVDMILYLCKYMREKEGVHQIALSGGVFQNVFLLERSVYALKKNGFDVYYNQVVPPNDGGLSLGQAYLGLR